MLEALEVPLPLELGEPDLEPSLEYVAERESDTVLYALVVGLTVLEAEAEELGLALPLGETLGDGEFDGLKLLLGDADIAGETLALEVGQLEMDPEAEELGLKEEELEAEPDTEPEGLPLMLGDPDDDSVPLSDAQPLLDKVTLGEPLPEFEVEAEKDAMALPVLLELGELLLDTFPE